MNRNDDLLNFLVEGLIAPQRDLVTRAFYKFAEGDPDSAPVNEAILLTACARRVSQAPQELREASADFKKLLAEGREMEARIRERVELSNFGVIAEFKDETRRAMNAWRETVEQANRVGDKATKIAREMEPVITTVKQIARDLPPVADDLKQHRESAKEIAVEVGLVKMIHQENQALIGRLGKEARANWITIGLLAGICLSAVFTLLPWWGGSLSFVAAIGLIQWLSRWNWKFVKERAETMKTTDQLK